MIPKMCAFALCGALAILPSSLPAAAQSASPADQGYMDAMAKMQKDMPKDMSGDPDVDLARMMIPHHQSAIDMAKVHLKHGKDAKLREMSEKIVRGQEKEIKQYQAWLKNHGH